MTYTVWSGGKQIGETDFELNRSGRKRAGVFRPTGHGLAVLPGITSVFPALLDFRQACERRGVDPDAQGESEDAAVDVLSSTPEGERVVAAARQIAQLELRDPAGRILAWESIAISDLEDIRRLAARFGPEDAREEAASATGVSDASPRDPVRFMISATLKRGVREDTRERRTAPYRRMGTTS